MNKTYVLVFLMVLLGTGSCVGQKSFEAKSIRNKIKEGASIYVENQEIDVPLLFSEFVNPDVIGIDVMEHRIVSSITFMNCTFKAPVGIRKESDKVVHLIFERNLSFVGCTFQDSVLFHNIKVLGRTDFTKSTFKKEANFQNAKFEDVVTFSNADFEFEAKFQNAYFNRNASFFRTEFIANTFFKGCFFHQKANFGAATFYEYGDFGLATFVESTNFNHTKFLGRGTFGDTKFKDEVTFNSCEFGNYTFEHASFYLPAEFRAISIDQRLDFRRTTILNGSLDVSPKNETDGEKISY